MVNDIIKTIKKGKEGLIIGLISGYLIAKFVLPYLGIQTIEFSAVDAGLIDSVVNIEPTQKGTIALSIIGGFVGFIADLYKDKQPLKRLFK